MPAGLEIEFIPSQEVPPDSPILMRIYAGWSDTEGACFRVRAQTMDVGGSWVEGHPNTAELGSVPDCVEVPEPGIQSMLAAGVIVLALIWRRVRHSPAADPR